jgi:hypothetical protein
LRLLLLELGLLQLSLLRGHLGLHFVHLPVLLLFSVGAVRAAAAGRVRSSPDNRSAQQAYSASSSHHDHSS